MHDFIYLLITLASFAAMALLVGVIDRRLSDADDSGEPETPGGATADEQPMTEVVIR